jgi:hypothetical protein
MSLKIIDCRQVPSQIGCTVIISGVEDEVLDAAAAHAITRHGHQDTPELRDMLRGAMQDAETYAGMRTASQAGPGEAATVVNQFNTAWNAHDLAAALALTSDDCVFEATSPAPDGQRHVGHAAITAAWKPIFDDAGSRFTVEDSFTAGRHVVQRWRYDWDGGHVRGVDIFTVQDGKVTEKSAYVKG